MALLPVAEALARILGGVKPTEDERVALADADRRVLAEDLAAKLTQPPFASSAMDGYAVRASDLTAVPARLKVIGGSAAGHGFGGPIGAREAVRIFTGAPLPEGADSVVIQENTEAEGDEVIVREGVARGQNVRGRGIDFEAGQVALRAGRVLDAHALALAAATGHGEVSVRRRPVVAILATGDELVGVGATPGPDQIVSSVPVGLASLVTRAGGLARPLGIARDSAESIAGKLEQAHGADVLVTVGGASVGDHDLVASVLTSRGLALDFRKLAMRPGKPLIFGRLGAMRVLGLPGNPVSALICARVFLVPLVQALLGREARAAAPERARLTRALEANGPRLHLMRAKLSLSSGGELTVATLSSQDSSLLSALADADCLIVRQPDAPAAEAGAMVEIQRLDF